MADTKKKTGQTPTKKSPEKTQPKEVKAKKTEEKKIRVQKPRNYDLGNGVYRFSRSRMYKKRAMHIVLKKAAENKKKETGDKKVTIRKKAKKQLYVKKPIGGDKNGDFRMVRVKKLPNYYPTAPKLKKKPTRKTNFANHKRFLRKSIKPGQVLIIVAGKHRGKRVVFLNQLKTGLLLVTGPYKLNKCPLRRMNQIFVIATRTRLDMSEVKIPDHLNDDYFKRKRPRRPKKDEGEIFETKKEGYKASAERKTDQIEVDKQILEVVRKHQDRKYLFGYLGSKFSLRNHMYPHKMKF